MTKIDSWKIIKHWIRKKIENLSKQLYFVNLNGNNFIFNVKS